MHSETYFSVDSWKFSVKMAHNDSSSDQSSSSEESGDVFESEGKGDSNEKVHDIPASPDDFVDLHDPSGVLKRGGEFKDFFWDDIIKYATSAMVALTLLDILATFLGDTVHCMTPSNFTRDQGAFLNNYCSQYTPPTDYFPFYLVVQVTVIFGLHFLWYSWFSGKFRYFLALATSLDRHREAKTGDYSLNNFVKSRALVNTYEGSTLMYRTYLLKLLAQFVFSAFSIYFNFDHRIFGRYDVPFECPPDEEGIPSTWPIADTRVDCVLSSLVVLEAFRYLNVILLVCIFVSVLCGFVWCLWSHCTKLNWVLVARFSFDSGLPPSTYVPKRRISRYNFKKSYFREYRIKNDFDFLFLKLFREDAGHAKVLREVLIDDILKNEEQRQLERLSLWRKLGKQSTALGMSECV